MRCHVDPCSLRSLLERVVLCADDESRPPMSAVQLEALDVDGGYLYATATQGHVLCRLRVPCVIDEMGSLSVTVESVQQVVRVLPRARPRPRQSGSSKNRRVRVGEPRPCEVTSTRLEYDGTSIKLVVRAEAFPAYGRLISGRNDGPQGSGAIGIAGQYLVLAGRVHPHKVELRRTGPLDSITFSSSADDLGVEGVLIVMPMRI